jgi:hypothetical protein
MLSHISNALTRQSAASEIQTNSVASNLLKFKTFSTSLNRLSKLPALFFVLFLFVGGGCGGGAALPSREFSCF